MTLNDKRILVTGGTGFLGKAVGFGQFGDGCEAWVDKTRLAGERRTVFIHLSSREAPHLRKLAEFCKQAADWMEDEQ